MHHLKAFMNEVAKECMVQRHHPEWTNVFNRVVIRWTTHAPRGMSLKDTYMARFCDEAAERHGEQWPDPAGKVLLVEEPILIDEARTNGPKKRKVEDAEGSVSSVTNH
jgi:hypothetical protein